MFDGEKRREKMRRNAVRALLENLRGLPSFLRERLFRACCLTYFYKKNPSLSMESDRQQQQKKKHTTKKTHISIAKIGFLLVDYCNVYSVSVAAKLGILLKKVKWG